MEPRERSIVKAALIEYLSLTCWGWNWVVTQTFDSEKVPLHRDICKDAWTDLLARTGRDATSCWGFVFAENGAVNGRAHFHALVSVQVNLFHQPMRNEVWKHMFDKYGRCRIEPYIQMEDVKRVNATTTIGSGIARYLTKYVVKGSESEDAYWDFGGFLGGRPTTAAQLCSAIGVPTIG